MERPIPHPPPAGGAERSASARWAFFALGWGFFALGIVGALLPVVPTTPFMLLALWAFSRSSRRFHDWLFHHRIFGAALRRWQRERVLPRWVKAIAFTSMAASMTYVAAVIRPPWYALLGMAAAVAGGVWFIARIPGGPSRAPGVDVP